MAKRNSLKNIYRFLFAYSRGARKGGFRVGAALNTSLDLRLKEWAIKMDSLQTP